MNGIKLPLRVEDGDEAVRVVDAAGNSIDPYDFVAIVNASQPLAFSNLTLAKLHEIIEEDIADPQSMRGDARSLLRRLQAFARPKPTDIVKTLSASDLINAHADAMAFARAHGEGLDAYGEHMRASLARLLSEGGAA